MFVSNLSCLQADEAAKALKQREDYKKANSMITQENHELRKQLSGAQQQTTDVRRQLQFKTQEAKKSQANVDQVRAKPPSASVQAS